MASKPRVDTLTLDELREAIATTKAKQAALRNAPVPFSEAAAALEAGLDQLAGYYDPDPGLAEFTRPGGGADLETLRLVLPDARFDPASAIGLVVALHRGPLLAFLQRRLQALYSATPELALAVPLAGRSAEGRRLRDTLRALELDEERLIVAAEGRGQTIDRRADVDPSVLFDAAVLEPPPSAA
jgi:hypothetical protein